jgi:hypothetical protein
MVDRAMGDKPEPAKRVEVTTQPGLPLGEDEDAPTDEHPALGDTEETTDEHLAVNEQPTDPESSTGAGAC